MGHEVPVFRSAGSASKASPMPTGATADPSIRGRTTRTVTQPPKQRSRLVFLEGGTVPGHGQRVLAHRGSAHITAAAQLGSEADADEFRRVLSGELFRTRLSELYELLLHRHQMDRQRLCRSTAPQS